MSKERLYIFDTTLRDGAQTQGVDFSIKDKEKIALALDVRNGLIALSGWKRQTKISALEFIKKIENLGLSRIIYTDIEKDGTKTGPNIKETINLSEKIKIPFIFFLHFVTFHIFTIKSNYWLKK